jgi:DNA-binding SARP family transcriptional activator
VLLIRVVGAVGAEVDGTPVDLAAAARARALLAWLALHPGEHPRGDLAARLRPDVPDASARKSLRQAVWTLRSALGAGAAEAIVAGRDRVGLSDDPGLVRVDIRIAAGRRAAGDLEGALALACGELLPGLDDEWAHELREAHREEVRGMLGEMAEAAARRGDLPAAIGWARRRVAEDPHNERAARALVALLARAGDRAGAIAAVDALRERLRRDLGIVPSAETRELAAAVRAGDPGASAAGGSTATPLPAPLVRDEGLAGRRDALERLRGAWRDASAGRLRLVCVTGEPGIGKTRTAAALAAEVHARGAAVLYGRCDEDALVPHQPFVEALERHLRALPPAEREEVIGPHRAGLARILPAVDAEGPPAADDPETARYRAFEAVRGLVEAIARRRPCLLVLDDVHWLDRAGLMLLRHLCRMVEDARLMVLATYRDTEVGRGHPLAAALGDLERELPVAPVALTGLDEDAVRELVRAAGGRDEDARVLGGRARGNPLLLGELVRAGAAAGAGAGEVPRRVVELLGRRVDRLGAGAADALATAALLGPRFAPDLLEELHGPGALEALERAHAAGLVSEEDAAAGRHAFTHALVAEALADRLSPARRRRRHRDIAAALVPHAEADPATHAAAVARHLVAALPDADRGEAVRWCLSAAARARDLLAHEEAAAHLDRALGIMDADDPRRAETLADLGDAADRAGDRAAARAAFDEAGRRAGTAGDGAMQARAALGAGGLGVVVGPFDPRLARALEAALAAAGTDAGTRARLRGRLAIEHYYPDRARADALSADAVEEARGTGDPGALAAALNARRVAIWDIAHTAERLEVATAMTAAAHAADEPAAVLQGRAWRVVDLMELGRLEEARAEVARYAEEADALGLPHYRWWAALWRGALALLAGDLAAVGRHGAQALALGRRADDPNAPMHVAIQALQADIDAGRVDRFDRAFVERSAASSPAAWAWTAWLAWADASLGDRARAERLVDELAADDFAAIRLDANWHAVADLAEALGVLGEGQADRAARLHALLAPYAGRIGVVGRGAVVYGPIDTQLGLLALLAGDRTAAVAHLEEAVAICERIGAGPRAARARARLEAARGGVRR